MDEGLRQGFDLDESPVDIRPPDQMAFSMHSSDAVSHWHYTGTSQLTGTEYCSLPGGIAPADPLVLIVHALRLIGAFNGIFLAPLIIVLRWNYSDATNLNPQRRFEKDNFTPLRKLPLIFTSAINSPRCLQILLHFTHELAEWLTYR